MHCAAVCFFLSSSNLSYLFQAAPSIECSSIAPGDNFEESIKNFDEQFSAALISLLHKINELALEDNSEKMLNVLCRYVKPLHHCAETSCI